ncbi:MAG: cytochrome c [Pirellulales bacterium]
MTAITVLSVSLSLLGWAPDSLVPAAPPIRRSRQRTPLPKWEQLPSVFFADAFRDALRGQRPGDRTVAGGTSGGANSNQPGSSTEPTGGPKGSGDSGSGDSSTDGTQGWAAIVDAAVLEDEVKRQLQELDKSLVSAGKFRSEGHELAADQLSLLAADLAVISVYEGDIRWKKDAAALASLCRQAAQAAPQRSAESFQKAQLARDALADAVRGNAPPDLPAATSLDDWSQLLGRPALMRRLELASDQRLPGTFDGAAVKDADVAKHEAQIVRLLTRLLMQPGMEDGGDPDYVKLCEELDRAAAAAASAAARQDAATLNQAVGEIKKSCATCHESYRG